MRVHKRKKRTRIRGAKTCGWGFRQKHKGHGNKGGRGMAGSGKRANHKQQFARNLDKNKIYFGKQGLTSRSTKKKKSNSINLRDIMQNFFKKEGEVLDFSEYKILGEGDGFKAEILAKSATKSAIEKMQEASGKITIVSSSKGEEKEEVDKSTKKNSQKKKKN